MVSMAPSTPPRREIAPATLKHGFLHEVGQFVHDVGALHRVLRLGPAALLVDDQLNRQERGAPILRWGW